MARTPAFDSDQPGPSTRAPHAMMFGARLRVWRALAVATLAAVAASVCLTAASSQDGSPASPFGNHVSLHLDRGALRTQPGGPALVDKVDGSAL